VIVVDASAVLLALLEDGDVRAMLSQETLVSPHLIDVEIVHALRRQVLRGEIDAALAAGAIQAWGQMGVERIGATGLLGRIWELRENLTAYDATYVALAEAMEVPLVTSDARLAQAPGPRCPMVVVRR